MPQRRSLSLLEALTQTLLGFPVLTGFQMWVVLPLFEIEADTSQNIGVSALMAVGAFVKTYLVRRAFSKSSQGPE